MAEPSTWATTWFVITTATPNYSRNNTRKNMINTSDTKGPILYLVELYESHAKKFQIHDRQIVVIVASKQFIYYTSTNKDLQALPRLPTSEGS